MKKHLNSPGIVIIFAFLMSLNFVAVPWLLLGCMGFNGGKIVLFSSPVFLALEYQLLYIMFRGSGFCIGKAFFFIFYTIVQLAAIGGLSFMLVRQEPWSIMVIGALYCTLFVLTWDMVLGIPTTWYHPVITGLLGTIAGAAFSYGIELFWTAIILNCAFMSFSGWIWLDPAEEKFPDSPNISNAHSGSE